MDAVQRMYNRLEAGSATLDCSGYLASLDPFSRAQLFTGLLYERLQRKHDYILDTYRTGGEYWDQVLFVLLFRFMGAPSNTRAFERLVKMISYPVIHRYLSEPQRLEALLIGGSGLLDLYPNDAHTHETRNEFYVLSRKHNLQKMHSGEWTTTRILPHNNPVLRLSQAVAILSQPEGFDIARILACKTSDDICRLFMHEASEYWLTHFTPGVETSKVDKRLGRSKAEILAINVVTPLQFTYGSYISSDRLRDRALNLLDDINPEDNSKVRRWKDGGFIPRSAFDTQTLIQLADEYCNKRRCKECPIARRIINSLE